MLRLILLVVMMFFLFGCTGPRVYPVVGVPGAYYVNTENSRQDGPNISCIDRWKDGKLLQSDCAGGSSLTQSLVSGSLQGAVGQAVRRTDNYDGDDIDISIEQTQKKKHKKKYKKKRKHKHY